MQENLEVFHKNLDLNPSLKSRIEIIECPAWSRSGVEMSFSSRGPAARVMEAGSAEHSHVSLSIDDAVNQYAMPRVDFIKMDIEGAEFDALQGARQTIIQHRPDLALCVYHSVADFTRLADFMNDLNLGYRFHLGHFTMHEEETVLFATAQHN
jgi:FkbM family methyltransferase